MLYSIQNLRQRHRLLPLVLYRRTWCTRCETPLPRLHTEGGIEVVQPRS
jgi:hypothetical protein